MDAEGYFDGHAQREKGVDLKTISRNGTGGFVVVAPSTGKSWVRPLWAAPILPMPEGLLEAVATPLHMTADVLLSFPDGGGEEFLHGARYLKTIEYMLPFLEGRWGAGDGRAVAEEGGDAPVRLPVPVDRATFMELLHVLEFGELTGKLEPTQELFHQLKTAADMMCVKPKFVACLRRDRVKRPHEEADLFALSPPCWRADAGVLVRRRGKESGDPFLVRVDAALADELRFAPFAPKRTNGGCSASCLSRAGGRRPAKRC